jgi:hypothetical protein
LPRKRRYDDRTSRSTVFLKPLRFQKTVSTTFGEQNKMKSFFGLLLLACIVSGCATSAQKTRYPVWYVPARHTDTYGIGVGILSPVEWCDPAQPSSVTGIRAELLGTGLLWSYFSMEYGFYETYGEYIERRTNDVAEIIRGVDVALSGSTLNANVYGVSGSGVSNVKNNMFGIMISPLENQTRHISGMQAAAVNRSYSVNGIQAGLFSASRIHRGAQFGLINHTERLNGFQIGLWNRNQERSLPLFNWARSTALHEPLPYDRWFPMSPKWRVTPTDLTDQNHIGHDRVYVSDTIHDTTVKVYRFWGSGNMMMQYHYDELSTDHVNSFRNSNVGYYAIVNNEIEIETYLDSGMYRGMYFHEQGYIDDNGDLVITHSGRRSFWSRRASPLPRPVIYKATSVDLEDIAPDW